MFSDRPSCQKDQPISTLSKSLEYGVEQPKGLRVFSAHFALRTMILGLDMWTKWDTILFQSLKARNNRQILSVAFWRCSHNVESSLSITSAHVHVCVYIYIYVSSCAGQQTLFFRGVPQLLDFEAHWPDLYNQV